MYYRGAAAAVVVYDITSEQSFERAKKWIIELRQLVCSTIAIAIAILIAITITNAVSGLFTGKRRHGHCTGRQQDRSSRTAPS